MGRPRATTFEYRTPTRESPIDVKPFTVRLNLHGDLTFSADRRHVVEALNAAERKDVSQGCDRVMRSSAPGIDLS